mmetsp:Transcript_96448/g.155611  ORF Transcript_96448/g.155611 Transcript_96448/m.155611 type:complete len:205 (+) Transcript_96448:701-1315(+)
MQITSEHTSNFAASMQETVAKNQELEKQVEQFMAAQASSKAENEACMKNLQAYMDSLSNTLAGGFAAMKDQHDKKLQESHDNAAVLSTRVENYKPRIPLCRCRLSTRNNSPRLYLVCESLVRQPLRSKATTRLLATSQRVAYGGGVTGSMHSMHSVQHTMGYRPQQEQQMPFWEAQSPSGSFQVGGMLGMTSDGGSQTYSLPMT